MTEAREKELIQMLETRTRARTLRNGRGGRAWHEKTQRNTRTARVRTARQPPICGGIGIRQKKLGRVMERKTIL